MTQSEQGFFAESKDFARISLGSAQEVFCSVGDFNGDASLDIMVTQQITVGVWLGLSTEDKGFNSTLYLSKNSAFTPLPLNVTFFDQPTVVDINGDGASDILGFVNNVTVDTDYKLYCLAGNSSGTFHDCSAKFLNFNHHEKPFPSFSPIFADVDGDLSSEIIFGMISSSGRPVIKVWKMINENMEWRYQEQLSKQMPENPTFLHFGGAVVGDFNADAVLDIMIPVCREEDCRHITHFLVWSKGTWVYFQLDQKDVEFIAEDKSRTVFRVGDFSLDGYPDLIATVKSPNKPPGPMIVDNVESDNGNFYRKFELKTTPRFVMTPEMSKGDVKLSAFFDLKEDGNLDILCDDKGDTTFLKVQIFSNVCTNDCPYNPKSSRKTDIGSGVTWHGACVSFLMTDSWGKTRNSIQCQLPQTSHRVLHSPFVLFGLGRSPNFVDEVLLGSPRWHGHADNQRSMLKQIVPNSRIIVVPPEQEGTHWQSRLYLTPSRLIIQSLLVLVSVCGILLLLIFFLHFRERRQDRKERQSQTHRFHFDAIFDAHFRFSINLKDYYKILGVPKGAKDSEIKKAYYQLAKKYHPDVNKEKSASEKFQELSEAYEVLSDSKKRTDYDQFGSASNATGQSAGGYTSRNAGWQYHSNKSAEDLFRDLFGDFDAFSKGRKRRPFAESQQGFEATQQVPLNITFEEAARGAKKELNLNVVDNCQKCTGSGVEPGYKKISCPYCNGTGVTSQHMQGFYMQTTCTRSYNKNPCKECEGAGQTVQRRQCTVNIPAGIDSDQILRTQLGNAIIYVVVTVSPSLIHRRENENIFTDVEISLAQAVLGGKMRLPGLGMKKLNASGYGDQFVNVKIRIPKNLGKEALNILKEYARMEKDTPGTIEGIDSDEEVAKKKPETEKRKSDNTSKKKAESKESKGSVDKSEDNGGFLKKILKF
uniref:Uncharacterized protein n=1 Tax=Ditylenchus dipsaci TaxID=166011 RepID=A0A915EKH9_9BILA